MQTSIRLSGPFLALCATHLSPANRGKPPNLEMLEYSHVVLMPDRTDRRKSCSVKLGGYFSLVNVLQFAFIFLDSYIKCRASLIA